MARSIRLRPWQKACLEKLGPTGGGDFLAVATPGAGKTTLALTAARQALAAGAVRRVVVVTPTAHLKAQWALAAARFDLTLDPAWSPRTGLAGDMHGVVTTYQQVATSARALAKVSLDAFVVFDEVHHAADERAWGDALTEAFGGAHRRLSLSGTPFRSDTRGIPFVRYVQDEAVADYEYGYGQALTDGRVVRPVYFPRIDGHMEWTAPDGSMNAATFADDLDRERAAQRLRTALSVDGEWLPTVLSQANARLREIREAGQPDAGGLVIATDQDHAKGIARILRDRTGAKAVVVTSDDKRASSKIAQFATSDEPWIVAVRMVSEGVDIPRLRVGVFATTTTTELFFRQAVGRLVRWQAAVGRYQPAFLFIPDDARLRARAHQIADSRRHSLRKDGRDAPERDAAELDLLGEKEQMSLFSVISAVALGDGADHDVPEWLRDVVPAGDDGDEGFELTLPPLPGGGSAGTVHDDGDGGDVAQPKLYVRRRLRYENAEYAKALVERTGLGHAAVNAELNRIAGVDRITEATVEQLEKRRDLAAQWLSSTSR
jgi:superfamily II DNA or RNA helicase